MITRKNLIKKLINEGFSNRTLINFNDKQLTLLANKVLKEGLKVKADDLQKNPGFADKFKDKDITIVPEQKTKIKKENLKNNDDVDLPMSKTKSTKKLNDKTPTVKEKRKSTKKVNNELPIVKGKRKIENVEKKVKKNGFIKESINKNTNFTKKGDIIKLIREKVNTFVVNSEI